MNDGMLWFDNSNGRNIADKIRRAADYYETKYGTKPTLCFVHPTMFDGSQGTLDVGIEVRTTNSVLPNHFWLGVPDKTRKVK